MFWRLVRISRSNTQDFYQVKKQEVFSRVKLKTCCKTIAWFWAVHSGELWRITCTNRKTYLFVTSASICDKKHWFVCWSPDFLKIRPVCVISVLELPEVQLKRLHHPPHMDSTQSGRILIQSITSKEYKATINHRVSIMFLISSQQKDRLVDVHQCEHH